MKFTHTTGGSLVNVDHVAVFRRHADGATYEAISARGEGLGTFRPVDVGDLIGPPAIVPNMLDNCVVIEFWFQDDGSYSINRSPVLAWEIHLGFGSLPVCLDELPPKVSGYWVIELPEDFTPRYVKPDDCAFGTFDGVIAFVDEIVAAARRGAK